MTLLPSLTRLANEINAVEHLDQLTLGRALALPRGASQSHRLKFVDQASLLQSKLVVILSEDSSDAAVGEIRAAVYAVARSTQSWLVIRVRLSLSRRDLAAGELLAARGGLVSCRRDLFLAKFALGVQDKSNKLRVRVASQVEEFSSPLFAAFVGLAPR